MNNIKLISVIFMSIFFSQAIEVEAEIVKEDINLRVVALKKEAEDFKVIREVSYGENPLQRMDIYAPKNVKNAPVIFMVHGGAWKYGDKSSNDVITNKVNFWVAKGYVFISTNYRMLPSSNVKIQTDDILQAIITAQKMASGWGGDANKFILIGHSAGAHLVSFISANPSIANHLGAKPWLGTVSLDSAALDLPEIMTNPHLGFYDEVFGKDPTYWQSLSPLHQLKQNAAPYLLICSNRHEIVSCNNAERFSDKAKKINVKNTVLSMNLTHMEINEQLGLTNEYTNQVDNFIKNLLPPN
jgi:arylformamidase